MMRILPLAAVADCPPPLKMFLRPQGTYNASSRIVFLPMFLQKPPCGGLQTEAPSSHETTGEARSPRWRRRLQQCCMARRLSTTARLDPVRSVDSKMLPLEAWSFPKQ
jgi:hypothetical protein